MGFLRNGFLKSQPQELHGQLWFELNRISFLTETMMEVVVIGAGVIGLSTALRLVESHRDLKVTVIADKDFQQITSYGPAGICFPKPEYA